MHVAHMAAMGLLVAVVAPAVLRVALVVAPGLDRRRPHAALVLGGFVVLHAVDTLGTATAWNGAALLVLLLGALVFWTPVLGDRRLPPAQQVVYLFAAMPLLDLAGVWLVARGDSVGGLAMIVGMLPMAGFAVAVTWRWVTAEERAEAETEAVEGR